MGIQRHVAAAALATLTMAFLWGGLQSAWAFPARVGLGPDNNGALLKSVIRGAQSSLLINIYEFNDPSVAEVLVERIRAGVKTEILIEGQPFGSVNAEGYTIIRRLQKEIANARRQNGTKAGSRLFLMALKKDPQNPDKRRRFVYNHAKYVIADGLQTLVSSENFSSTGHTADGQVGNRGWEVVMESRATAQELERTFRGDIDTSFGDVTELKAGTPLPIAEPHGTNPDGSGDKDDSDPLPEGRKPRPVPAIAEGRAEVSRATFVFSPESFEGIQKFMRTARESLELEFMSLPPVWRYAGEEPSQSGLVTELLEAARRGANVRVLLNDESVFPGDPKDFKNPLTVDLLNKAAKREKLNLQAAIVKIGAVGITYIHNKGMIVDGERALVSSVNGTLNSVQKNREVGVALESRDAAEYYLQAFNFDWTRSVKARIGGDEDRPTDLGSQPFTLTALFAPAIAIDSSVSGSR